MEHNGNKEKSRHHTPSASVSHSGHQAEDKKTDNLHDKGLRTLCSSGI